MLSKEDSRRLAQLERQLRRDDPEFCARMAGGAPPQPARIPLSLVLTALVIWVVALVLAVSGWWIAAGVAALWATIVGGVVSYRMRRPGPGRHRPAGPDPLPPAW